MSNFYLDRSNLRFSLIDLIIYLLTFIWLTESDYWLYAVKFLFTCQVWHKSSILIFILHCLLHLLRVEGCTLWLSDGVQIILRWWWSIWLERITPVPRLIFLSDLDRRLDWFKQRVPTTHHYIIWIVFLSSTELLSHHVRGLLAPFNQIQLL